MKSNPWKSKSIFLFKLFMLFLNFLHFVLDFLNFLLILLKTFFINLLILFRRKYNFIDNVNNLTILSNFTLCNFLIHYHLRITLILQSLPLNFPKKSQRGNFERSFQTFPHNIASFVDVLTVDFYAHVERT